MLKAECKSRSSDFRSYAMSSILGDTGGRRGGPCGNYQKVVKDFIFYTEWLTLKKMDLQEFLTGIIKAVFLCGTLKTNNISRADRTKLHSVLHIHVVRIYLHLREGIKSPENFT